ncbi:MAG TPA: serine/threonine-protein kinase [Polyangiaceae bacterium]|nr:serine/threonine-protein kinase [Polyangiaceae bacterium]
MTAEVHERDTLLGTTLADSYILDKVLGEGSMGRVYLARHTRIASKRFAIKVLHTQYARHTEALERFKREAEAAALVSSQHVVGVQDYGRTHDGRPFMVYDFLVGEELADRLLREGQLPIGDAVRIVRQVCSGLAVAHANGIIHRDVKPENVFLVGGDDELTAMLLDFGISRFHEGGKVLTQAGTTLGTPDYMSPEQARGMRVDHRSDIYAVGVMLYRMLTGVMPFERESPHETLLALLSEEAPAPRFIEPSIPEHLEGIVLRAMAKEPTQRYQWIAELSQALAPYDPSHVARSQGGVVPSSEQPSQQASQQVISIPSSVAPVSHARAWIVGFMALAMPAGFVLLLLAVMGLLTEAGVEMSSTTWAVATIVLVGALSTPVWLVFRSVGRVWRNTALRESFAQTLHAPLITVATLYALATLALRFAKATELDIPDLGILWDSLLFALVAAGGSLAYLIARPRG